MRRAVTAAALVASAAVAVGFNSTDTRRVIYVRNESGLSAQTVRNALPAFQQALDHDFFPAWDSTARLVYIGRAQAPKGSWRIVLENFPNCVGCGGFHEWKGYARAEVGRQDWQITFSHELFEMLADPVVEDTGNGGRMIANGADAWLVEVSDPVETESYKINGVTISDFVLPAWYSGIGDGPYDFLKRCSSPLQILPDGYAWVIRGGSWTAGA